MAVRRECNPGIEIPKYELRCASKYWSAIQIPLALRADAGLTEVNIVPVRREGESTVDSRCRRKYLSVTAGRNVAQPQARLAVIVLHIQDVLTVGRDCGLLCPACIRDLRHDEVLKWSGSAPAEQGVDTETPGGE